MPWKTGQHYDRPQLEQLFPGLDRHAAVFQQGGEVAIVLLADNRPGYANWISGPMVHMEVNAARRAHNAVLRDPDLPKVLFWSNQGGDYICLGAVVFKSELAKGAGLGPMYVFEITDPPKP